MKKFVAVAGVFAVLFLFSIPSECFSAERYLQRRGPDGWGPGSKYGAMYNPGTVETVTGKVTSIRTFTPPGGMYGGVHLTIATDRETVEVHLGPKWFIVNQDFELNVGDTIDVKGSRVTYKGKAAIIAAHIKKGDEELLLRDENGIPYWAAYRRKAM